ncbi:MAG: NAD(P)-dependent oxidoreductase [Actinomycetota bacterium]
MRAVVFGGSGFIGKHLVPSLVSKGYDVTVADLQPGEPGEGAQFVECDVRKPIPFDIAEPPLEVYNLAAVHRVPGHKDHEYFEANVAGAENVAGYCQSVGVQKLCFTSSISVYGPSEHPLGENSPTAPVSAYGRSKLEAEGIYRQWALDRSDRRLVIARPAVIFGPWELGNFSLLARALTRRTFIYPGRTDTIKACSYVGELIRSFEFALGLDRRVFLYNLCYPHPYSIREICETFHQEWGLPLPMFTAPGGPMLAAAWFFEKLESVLGTRTGIGRTRVRKLMESTHIVPGALVKEGYEFETDLAEGLRRWRQRDPASSVTRAMDESRA